VAISQAKGLIAGSVKPTKRKRDWMSFFMEATPLRSVMFSKAKESVDKNSGGHYPAPYAIIDVLKNNFGKVCYKFAKTSNNILYYFNIF